MTIDGEDRQEDQFGAIPALSWRGIFGPLQSVPLGLFALFCLVAPANILDRSRIARNFTQLVSEKIPLIGNNVDPTMYPQVALVMARLSVCFALWLALVFLGQSIANYAHLLERQRRNRTVSWGQ